MAITSFYIQSGGSDLNSGSTNSNTPISTDTGGNGTYLQGGGAGGTDRYTANAGTPFSAATANVDWVSVYTGTPAATSFVGLITAVNAGGASIDISLTSILGTRPTNAATWKAIVGGAQADLLAVINYGATTLPGSTDFLIQSGVSITPSAAQTIALIGTTLKPLRLRGYYSSVGDLDMPPKAGSAALGNYPTIAYTSTGRLTCSGAYTTVMGLKITANVNNAVLIHSGNPSRVHNCIIINSSAGASALAFSYSASCILSCCYLSSVANNNVVNGSQALLAESCTFIGNGTGTSQHGAVTGVGSFHKCTFQNLGGNGFQTSTNAGSIMVLDCTFDGCGVDGIHVTGPPTAGSLIANNVFVGSGVNDINNASGGNTGNIQLLNNDTYFTGSGAHLAGFGDVPELGALTESSSPFVSSTDLHLQSTANGAGAGVPGRWTGL